MKFKKALGLLVATLLCSQAFAAKLLDKAAVIVDRGVILESEIASMVTEIKANALKNNQKLPSDKALRTQVTERLILRELQMQMAERAGFQVSDSQLQDTLVNIAQSQGMTIEQLKRTIDAAGLQGKTWEAFRDEIRIELITNEVRRSSVSRRVYVSPQEINSLVEALQQKGRENDEYHLGHILVGLPSEASAEDIEASKGRAEKVLRLLNDGSEFRKMAIASSSGEKALDGGDLGWMNINEMPTLFAEAVEGAKKGAFIGPIRSGAGFHILTIFDVRGREIVEVTETNSRHILIKPSIILSDAKAKEMLQTFLKDIKAGEADFAELAKKHSADPGSAAKGGELGWADPNVFVPEFRDALNSLQKDEFTGPFKTDHGWHIVQLIDRRKQDKTQSMQEEQAYQMLFKRKFAEESEAWYRSIRENAFIEILD
ncbi:peptidylprolyl isomerase SurA [Saccharobesus litoralis]|uniref:Chaperone SurA n=1 Tax=Saccharobesus litoralis TaxID=2172099 RepID=A0A2S0VXQ5_9ALTE|nr:peptidylprolyl isomerase SurA [Saccharobesus litoralis]AWB68991.1 peptidylprolyl isomerase SurA [Saccharobesus litoralis]